MTSGLPSFGDESDTVFLRNAVLRMIASRAQKYLVDPADLKHEVTVGLPTEELVRAGIQEKLDEILALVSCFRCQDPEIWRR